VVLQANFGKSKKIGSIYFFPKEVWPSFAAKKN